MATDDHGNKPSDPPPSKAARPDDRTLGEAIAHEVRPEEIDPRARPGAADDEPPARPQRPALYLAEFETTSSVLHAAEKLRDAGYTKFDTHTPFPIHGMDKAMGLPDSILGFIVLCFGLSGTGLAWLMMYWMNGVDYKIVIGGKPPGAFPSMVPIMFEVTILFSALSTVFGMFGLNKLPRHHHPIFYSDRFRGFSDDKFFLSVEAEDPKFDRVRTLALLESTHPAAIELVHEEEES